MSRSGRNIPTWLIEAVEKGSIPKEDIDYWLAYDKAFNNLLNDNEIPNFKIKRTLEKAKRLSVNAQFQDAVQQIRERWNITPHLYKESWLYPDTILREWAFAHTPSNDEWQALQTDLKTHLAIPFNLDWQYDYALIVAAVCLGLTTENLSVNWEKIWAVAVQESTPGVSLVTRTDERRKVLGAALTIAYLAKMIHDMGFSLGGLPEPIREWVQFALECCRVGSESLDIAKAPLVMKALKTGPRQPPDAELELYIRIRHDTTKADVIRTWPQVELRKVEMWGKKASVSKNKRIRQWKTFQRDVELTDLYEELADYDEVIYEYERRHPQELVPSYTDSGRPLISDDVRDLVRQAVKRVRDRVTRKHDS
jgi:hypothetical protein